MKVVLGNETDKSKQDFWLKRSEIHTGSLTEKNEVKNKKIQNKWSVKSSSISGKKDINKVNQQWRSNKIRLTNVTDNKESEDTTVP
jgi:hypothetical protein